MPLRPALTLAAGPVLAGSWSIVAVNGEPVTGASIIEFRDDGTFGGSTGCNRFVGTGEIARGALIVGSMGSTRMACHGEAINAQETAILSLFEGEIALDYDPFTDQLRMTRGTAVTVEAVRQADAPGQQ